MELEGNNCLLRPWRESDFELLHEIANNRAIWRNLGEKFPHPYTPDDARVFWEIVLNDDGVNHYFAIDVEGKAAGAITLMGLGDVYLNTARMGYWIGEPFWGKGIVTEAVELVTEYGFRIAKFARIEATVFEWNPASARVLEKCGYECEANLRKSCFKDGELIDMFLYAKISPTV